LGDAVGDQIRDQNGDDVGDLTRHLQDDYADAHGLGDGAAESRRPHQSVPPRNDFSQPAVVAQPGGVPSVHQFAQNSSDRRSYPKIRDEAPVGDGHGGGEDAANELKWQSRVFGEGVYECVAVCTDWSKFRRKWVRTSREHERPTAVLVPDLNKPRLLTV
jgi:hypothetical protein